MQHFLPSMSLLDGKPPPGLCNSPPPPPPVTRTLHHGAPPPSNRTISRGGRLPVGGSSDDISMIRKWRDLAIVVAGRENPLLSHDQGGTPVAVVEKTWARSGSGGPTVDPGSYAEIFQESQRKKRRGCSSPPGEAGGSIVPRTTTTSRRENRGTRNENHVAARRREATRVENCAITSIGLRRRKPAGPEVGDHNVDGPGVSKRGAHGAVYSASNSLASYPGLTREERVTARRLALNQAQCRDNLGSGMVQRRRIVSRKTCVSSVRRNADARPSELTRLRGKRSNVDPPLTARGYPSAGRQADGGVSMETLRPGHNQVRVLMSSSAIQLRCRELFKSSARRPQTFSLQLSVWHAHNIVVTSSGLVFRNNFLITERLARLARSNATTAVAKYGGKLQPCGYSKGVHHAPISRIILLPNIPPQPT